MVTQWLFHAVASVIRYILALLPSWTAPDWLDGIGTDLSAIGEQASKISAWIPIGALRNALLVVGPAMLLALAMKVIRIVASFFTAGGGSAG